MHSVGAVARPCRRTSLGLNCLSDSFSAKSLPTLCLFLRLKTLPYGGLGRVKNQHVQSAAPVEYEVVAVPVLPAFTWVRAHCGPRGSGHWGFPENNPRVPASLPFSPKHHHLRVGSHRGPLAISDSLTSWCQMQRQRTGVRLNSPWHEGRRGPPGRPPLPPPLTCWVF